MSHAVGPDHVCDARCAHPTENTAREIVRRAREGMARNGGDR